jgi:cell division protein FtsB
MPRHILSTAWESETAENAGQAWSLRTLASLSASSERGMPGLGAGLHFTGARDEKLFYKDRLRTMPSSSTIALQKTAPRRTGAPEPLRRKQPKPPSDLPHWRKALNLLLVFAIIVLALDGLVGEKGLTETIRARRESEALAASVAGLKAENARLRGQALRLRQDLSAIEAIARQELGLVRPGEVLFILKDVGPGQK